MKALIAVLGGAIRVSTPFLFVSLGECITERAGRINLGLEGTMVFGAMFGYAVSYHSGSAWVGVLAAALCGWLAERGWDRSIVRVAAAMIIGHALILGLGTAWLSNLIGLAKGIQFGLAPFWAATIFKTALAMAALPLAWHFIGKRR